MAGYLRTNTATIIAVGPFLDRSDGVTIETSLTITNERITAIAETDEGSAPTVILDNVTGATSGTDNDLNYITGNDAGYMQLELTAANLNRLGRFKVSITDAANHVPVFHEFMILPAQVYDSLILGTDLLDANASQAGGTAWGSGAITAASIATGAIDADAIADNAIDAGAIAADAITAAKIADGAIDAATFAAGAITGTAIATGAIDADALASDAVAEIADGVWDEPRAGHSSSGSYGESFFGLVSSTAITGTLSTTAFTTSLTEATDDHYNGRIVVWLTGVLVGQATDITDYTGATKLVTVTAMTEAPSNGDRFIIV